MKHWQQATARKFEGLNDVATQHPHVSLMLSWFGTARLHTRAAETAETDQRNVALTHRDVLRSAPLGLELQDDP